MKKNWKIIIIVIVFFLLIASAVLRVLTPANKITPISPSLQTNYDRSQSSFKNAEYVGGIFSPPPKLSVARVVPTNTTSEYIKKQLISNFSLQPLAQPKNMWSGPSYTLNYQADFQLFSLTKNDPPTTNTAIINQDQAVGVAKKLLQQYFPNLSLVPNLEKIRFVGGGIEPDNTDAAHATQLFIPFSYTIDGYPIFYSTQGNFPFEVVVDNDYQIRKLTFYPQFISVAQSYTADTIGVAQAIKNINQGNATIVDAVQQDTGPMNLDEINSAKFTTISIEYRVDEKNQQAVPYYRFIGSSKNGDGSPVDIQVITPAVQTVLQQ